jgi:hypothetical protein
VEKLSLHPITELSPITTTLTSRYQMQGISNPDSSTKKSHGKETSEHPSTIVPTQTLSVEDRNEMVAMTGSFRFVEQCLIEGGSASQEVAVPTTLKTFEELLETAQTLGNAPEMCPHEYETSDVVPNAAHDDLVVGSIALPRFVEPDEFIARRQACLAGLGLRKH